MTMALSKAAEDGAQKVVCASTGNTSASAAAYAARAGIPCLVVVPGGQVALGKLAQAQAAGATVCAIDGSFDDALRLVRELCDRHPITLVNNLNPYRLEGQKTAAFEIVDELGVPRLAVAAGRQRRQHHRLLAGVQRGRQAGDAGRPAAAARLPGGRGGGDAAGHRHRRARHARDRDPDRRARCAGGGGAAPRASRRAASWPPPTRRSSTGTGGSRGSEGVFCEPSSATSVAGLARARAAGTVAEGERVVCVLTGHGLKDPDTAAAQGAGGGARAGHDRRRSSGSRSAERGDELGAGRDGRRRRRVLLAQHGVGHPAHAQLRQVELDGGAGEGRDDRQLAAGAAGAAQQRRSAPDRAAAARARWPRRSAPPRPASCRRRPRRRARRSRRARSSRQVGGRERPDRGVLRGQVRDRRREHRVGVGEGARPRRRGPSRRRQPGAQARVPRQQRQAAPRSRPGRSRRRAARRSGRARTSGGTRR